MRDSFYGSEGVVESPFYSAPLSVTLPKVPSKIPFLFCTTECDSPQCPNPSGCPSILIAFQSILLQATLDEGVYGHFLSHASS